MANVDYPAEVIELPSKGWYYPEGHPLASGKIGLRYMTAREEDILTSRTLIQRGIVIDKLLEALLEDKSLPYDDLLLGDKNGLIIASRIMGYGKNYDVTVTCPTCEEQTKQTVNLEELNEKKIELSDEQKGKNEFKFLLPASKVNITFKLLTIKDEREIQNLLDTLRKKVKGDVQPEVTSRIKKSILTVEGDADRKLINEFVDNMPARDALALRTHVREITPDIDFNFDFVCKNSECEATHRVEVPIDLDFFWPNAGV